MSADIFDNRDDYKPFITDETFGNAQLVAFARVQKVNLVVHKADTPDLPMRRSIFRGRLSVNVFYHGTDEEHYPSKFNIDRPDQDGDRGGSNKAGRQEEKVLNFRQVTGNNLPPSRIEKMILSATSYAKQTLNLDKFLQTAQKVLWEHTLSDRRGVPKNKSGS
ncbi:hypothetical protein BJ742DRAFT_872677 [Cladochytrium replicatum]|nr:hypothetical protein BJ742DRAFT_872677 [Cladochytrium replicatum]